MPRAMRICLTLVLVPLGAFAGDAWKEKPYRNWSEKEVRKILSSSPWAKELLIAYYPHRRGSSIETAETVQIGKVPHDPACDPLAIPDAQTEVWKPKSVYILR